MASFSFVCYNGPAHRGFLSPACSVWSLLSQQMFHEDYDH